MDVELFTPVAGAPGMADAVLLRVGDLMIPFSKEERRQCCFVLCGLDNRVRIKTARDMRTGFVPDELHILFLFIDSLVLVL
jgi:hypothetical protein